MRWSSGLTAKQALVGAGWFLFNAQAGHTEPVEILKGQSGADGMCRPTGYQAFVFVDGVFAGTLSPGLVENSRDDGALTEATVGPGDEIQATYVRYTPRDPLFAAPQRDPWRRSRSTDPAPGHGGGAPEREHRAHHSLAARFAAARSVAGARAPVRLPRGT